MCPRTGRPSDNPRLNKLSIRLSDFDKEILEGYCDVEGVTRTEAVSRGINKLVHSVELENAKKIKEDLIRCMEKSPNPQVPEKYQNSLMLEEKLRRVEALIQMLEAKDAK